MSLILSVDGSTETDGESVLSERIYTMLKVQQKTDISKNKLHNYVE